MFTRRRFMTTLAAGSAALSVRSAAADLAAPPDRASARVRSAKTGTWSSPATWEGGKPPVPGAFVEIQPGHVVTYDADSSGAIRMVHILGTLAFARDRDTRLDVGLLKIGGDAAEDG